MSHPICSKDVMYFDKARNEQEAEVQAAYRKPETTSFPMADLTKTCCTKVSQTTSKHLAQ